MHTQCYQRIRSAMPGPNIYPLFATSMFAMSCPALSNAMVLPGIRSGAGFAREAEAVLAAEAEEELQSLLERLLLVLRAAALPDGVHELQFKATVAAMTTTRTWMGGRGDGRGEWKEERETEERGI
eukprot:3934100-Rhodomonas_salina.1